MHRSWRLHDPSEWNFAIGRIHPGLLVCFGSAVPILHESIEQAQSRKSGKEIRSVRGQPTRPLTLARLDARHLQHQRRRLPDLVVRRVTQVLQAKTRKPGDSHLLFSLPALVDLALRGRRLFLWVAEWSWSQSAAEAAFEFAEQAVRGQRSPSVRGQPDG